MCTSQVKGFHCSGDLLHCHFLQEQLLLDSMFDVPDSSITAVHVDEAAVLGKSPVQYQHQSTADAVLPSDTELARTGHTEDSVAA